MSLAPHYQRPAAPVANSYPTLPQQAGVNPPAVSGTPAVQIPWQDFFGDARLKQMIGLALQNNRDLRVAVLNIEQARALYGVRSADQWPTVNIGISGSRSPSTTQSGALSSDSTAGVAVSSFELDLVGRGRCLSDAAFAQ